MKPSFLSFALLWAFKLGAASVPFNEAVQIQIVSRPPKPMPNSEQRYFLPGSSQPNPPSFIELDLRTDLQREELKGRVKRRLDFYPGGLLAQTEVSYDNLGRRLKERVLDKAAQVLFERLYHYVGQGAISEEIVELDGNGATENAVDFELDGLGLPLEEDHTDFQGLPVLHRSYGYDSGRLTSFKESEGARIRGLAIAWEYDHKGRLIRRTFMPEDIFAPQPETFWDLDWVTGGLLQRREYLNNLPVESGHTEWPVTDPRRNFSSRTRFEASASFSYLLPEELDGNNAFWTEKRRFKINEGGWLDEEEVLSQSGALRSREFWRWDRQQSLERHERWGGKKPLKESFKYDYDAQGNWIRRKSAAEDESLERKFEYFED